MPSSSLELYIVYTARTKRTANINIQIVWLTAANMNT